MRASRYLREYARLPPRLAADTVVNQVVERGPRRKMRYVTRHAAVIDAITPVHMPTARVSLSCCQARERLVEEVLMRRYDCCVATPARIRGEKGDEHRDERA